MVRIRSREATIVGLLALFAAPCAVESRAGQPYSVVGQSTSQTAATGRRPIAERIKAANRPIRIKAEADLAPDEGLIRDLSADAQRDWPIAPPVVELPGAEPIIVTADAPPALAADAAPTLAADGEPTPAAPSEPAVVPPPAADAVAANPTTADDAGAVGEVGGVEEPAQAGVAAVEEAPSAVDGPSTAPPVAPAPRPRTAAAPRRARPTVTPQRREALLDRLRAALAEMPRPFGLIPAPAPAPAPRRVRTVAPRAPLAVAVPPTLEAAPPALESAPPADTDPSVATAVQAPSDTVPGDVAGGDALTAVPPPGAEGLAADGAVPATDGAPATDGSTVPPAATAEAATTAVAETPAADAPATEGATELAATTTPAIAVPATDAVATTGDAGEAGGEPVTDASVESAPALEAVPATETALATTEHPAEDQAPVVAPRRAAPPAVRQAPRSRAPAPLAQRARPFGRLQATLDALPRPLGILPAPRPAMRGAASQPRRDAATIARSQPRRPAPAAPASPADAELAATPDASGTGDDTSAADGASLHDRLADAGTVTDTVTDVGTDSDTDTGTPGPAALAPADAVEVAADSPAAVDESPAETALAVADDATATDAVAAAEEAAACIEVVVEGPEGGVARGEEITLRLVVRNTGTASARAVTPMFHFGRGIEPRSAAGRTGTLTRKGSVVFESLPELAPGESLEVDVVAVCEHSGAVPFRAAVWCGEGDAAEEIPLDGELRVVPGPIASAPGRGTVR